VDKLQRMIKGKIRHPTGIEVRKSSAHLRPTTSRPRLLRQGRRMIKVEGSLENPTARHPLLQRRPSASGLSRDRLRTPLKRVGPEARRDGPISWTEALDTVVENLQRLKAESGPSR